jgi:tetratricopeptide (TPR) repeat protein
MMEPRLSPTVVRGLLLILAGAILAGLSPNPAPLQLSEQLSQARTSLAQGDAPGALSALDSALRLEPSLTMLHRPAAHAALGAHQPAAAVSHIEQALAADPGAGDLECLRLEALAEAGGLAAVKPVPATCQDSSRLHLLRAQALIAEGEHVQALAELEASASLATADVEGLQLRAVLSAALQPGTALAAVLEARAAGADDPLLTDLESILRTSSGASSFELAMRSGQVFLKHGRFQLAALAFQRAAELQPSDLGAQAYLAFSLSPVDPQAVDRLRTLRLQSPEVALAYLLEAMALRQGGAPFSAIPVLEAALELEPGSPALLAEIGATQLSAGDLPQAARGYRRAAEAARTDPAYWRLLAQFSLDHGVDPAGLALPAARNALVLDPASAEGWALLGQAHLLAGEVLLADRLLRTSIRLDPASPASHYHLGLARVSLEDPTGARAAFESVLRIDPEGPYAELARRSLETLAG